MSTQPPPPTQKNPPVRARRWTHYLLVGAGLAAASGLSAVLLGHPTRPAVAQAAPAAPPPVTVSQPLQKEVTEWDEYTGQFAAVDYVEIRARVPGYLTEIHFTDGQIVNKGDLLFVIDPRPYEIEQQQAQAQLATAESTLDLANRQLARAASLREKDFVAQSTYDERLQTMKSAAASVETGKAAVRQAQLDLEFSHVTAPLTGRISQHLVSIGNLVSGGATGTPTLLTTIVSLDPIYLNFDMSEAQFLAYERASASGKLKSNRDKGVPVFARLTDEAQWTREGIMNFVDNQVDRSAGTIRARGVFPNPNFFLTSGQFGRLRIPGSEPYQAILVPDAAVVTDQSSKLLLTVAEDGTVVPKLVRLGPTIDGLRVIRSGIDPKDRVIIDGLVRARPGAKVTPQPGEIKSSATAG
ncbi:MAG TPA: efflux RND transporter periplasmic adaptor subunit [Aliidongia sp.]|uniref:efflux RND transporter periplasmic adaptor subunit n=1 Tax=Aliidongia sp. TaxID=1914230 RepID=UPI002DDD2832|nr:efflux RND transporter periplasmic adaptor subunit [Aliidongia sp.]HEV2676282.1 efflux RND transporter periplasmic adaptor subunit [Aliidongia sp.]